MALSLEITKDISPKLLKDIVQMDHQAYPPQDRMPWAQADMIYGLVKDSLILLREDGRLIGHLSAYPIRPELIALAIRRQEQVFHIVKREHLLPDANGPVHGYIHNVILQKECRGMGYSRHLLAGFARWLETHREITYLWADAVSPGGQRALAKMGMRPRPALAGLWGAGAERVTAALADVTPDRIEK